MQTSCWLQLALYVVALAAITKPMGLYLMQVLDTHGKPGSTRPQTTGTAHLSFDGSEFRQRARLKQYTFAMLLFSLVGCLSRMQSCGCTFLLWVNLQPSPR
jgi:K+-transporting ATPase ATPase A chain